MVVLRSDHNFNSIMTGGSAGGPWIILSVKESYTTKISFFIGSLLSSWSAEGDDVWPSNIYMEAHRQYDRHMAAFEGASYLEIEPKREILQTTNFCINSPAFGRHEHPDPRLCPVPHPPRIFDPEEAYHKQPHFLYRPIIYTTLPQPPRAVTCVSKTPHGYDQKPPQRSTPPTQRHLRDRSPIETRGPLIPPSPLPLRPRLTFSTVGLLRYISQLPELEPRPSRLLSLIPSSKAHLINSIPPSKLLPRYSVRTQDQIRAKEPLSPLSPPGPPPPPSKCRPQPTPPTPSWTASTKTASS